MKKVTKVLLLLALLAATLTACAGKPQSPPKIGLGVITSAAKSADATDEADGAAQTDVLIAAVTLGADGKITACQIDAVQAKVNFTEDGRLSTPADAEFPTKNELGEAYGMKKESAIGKEWNQQAAAFASYVVGKTPAEVGGIAMTDGKPADADLAASVTIFIGDFMEVVQKAAANAV